MVFLLLIIGFRVNKETGFGRNKCASMQGIAALYVMLAHIHMFASYSSPLVWWLYPVNEVTILTNGLFFFISGYGLWESRKNKADYLSVRSLLCRLTKLCIPAYIVYLFYYFIRIYSNKEQSSFVKHLFLDGLFSWFYYNDVVWFIIELFFLYLIFWIVYSVWPTAVGNRILFVLIVLWTGIAALWGRGYVWYASTLCFFLGIVFSQEHGRNSIKYHKRAVIISALILVPVFILFIKSSENLGLLNAVYANGSSLLFCIICYLLSYKNSLGNIISNWLGQFSYEIYLCHMMILKVYNTCNVSDVIKIYGTICVSVFCAYILYIADTKIVNAVCRQFLRGKW